MLRLVLPPAGVGTQSSGLRRLSINSIIYINSRRSYHFCFFLQLKHEPSPRTARCTAQAGCAKVPDAMLKTDKDILTTADAARLVGVSVRTAQLLIEGGSIPSWKTPGGHRRVYRSDVEALIEGRETAAPVASAMVVVIAATERLSLYENLFAEIPECTVRTFGDPHAALFAIGEMHPSAVVVDLQDADPVRLALLPSLLDNPALGHSRILAVAAPTPAPGDHRLVHVGTPDAAVTGLRMFMADGREAASLPADACFPIALNERQRLAALERSGLVDTAPEEAFDRLTWLAAHTLEAPIALLTLLTPTRQWFKSRIGFDLPETPRSWAFCNHTILQKRVFSVEDLSIDSRFAENPAVVDPPSFRFYAGAPVLDGDGYPVGSLCVIDHQPRSLNPTQERALASLAGLASGEFRLRSAERQLREALRRAPNQSPVDTQDRRRRS
ncbi:GAF domain-containing protein [Aurantimonas endophytica]|uniref:Excisionase family DNA binding protein n=1 Tax=Aurantimonas endophytica TaxID=1522175 RepID=A0A7W6HEL7_9HYPH|nr:GAF domain-containing protein [Aurantimonas endophytica]MBB4003631.1 excisionase family DNA binding protein [Aurantimonas endophytica]